MNLVLTQEQQLIRDSVHDYLAGSYDFSAHFAQLDSKTALDAGRWNDMAQLGWLGINVSEGAGGIGGTAMDAWVVMEGLGASLCCEPVLSTAVLSAPLLETAAKNSAEAGKVLAQVLDGKTSVAFAHAESAWGTDFFDLDTVAEPLADGGYRISGKKTLVPGGAGAQWLIVPARIHGAANGDIGLFLVSGEASGLTRVGAPMLDGSWAADLVLDQVTVDVQAVLCLPEAGRGMLKQVMRRAISAQCAEAVGAMRAALAICKSYLLERRQFGKSLAEFQVLQHRYVDMCIAYERAYSMSLLAVDCVDAPTSESDLDLSRAKVVVGQAARKIGGDAIQVHGGMGMTYEYPIGHYYRKLLLCDVQFGSADEHLQSLMETSH
ncbi:acyl-CoA dehydrogenase family protein [Alcaligenaceae bacterium]|nr:acyl-CoA dehydrogenase family protein [Alcaligenaceae bacterium]